MRIVCVLILSALVAAAGIHASAVNTQHEPISHHVTSRMFHFMNAQSDFMTSVSSTCNDATQTLQANTAVIAANASIIHDGCFYPDFRNPDICTVDSKTMTFNCDCEPILSNTAWLYGNVTALGGKVCPVSVTANVVATLNKHGQSFVLHENIKQTSQELLVLGDKCTIQDIQTALEATVDQGVSELAHLLGKVATMSHYDIQASACGFSARRTSPGTAAKPSA